MIGATYVVKSAAKTPKGDILLHLVDAENEDDGAISMLVDGADDRDADEFAVGARFEVTLSRVK